MEKMKIGLLVGQIVPSIQEKESERAVMGIVFG